MFPGSEDSDTYKAISAQAVAKVAEEEAARRASIPPLAALRQIESRIESLARRETKLASAASRLHADLDAAEDDLATTRTELAAAHAERSAALGRLAIPNAEDTTDLGSVVHYSIQTLPPRLRNRRSK